MLRLMNSIPQDENIHLGADLNGHVGEKDEKFERWHGSFGYGNQNQDGKRILEFSASCDLAIINTFFKKKDTHLITYESGRNSTQIDYSLTRRKHLGRYKDSKVIPGEALTSQHKLLLSVYKLPKPLKICRYVTPKLKWQKLYDPCGESLVKELAEKIRSLDVTCSTANKTWNEFERFCRKSAERSLGRMKPRKGPFKETSW
ncbi:unnamed protein product [Chrysodeixis includens]|uniref:Endonuclease/exonuclease/phosphatase domain-containing protein n=1 Tax=Chrysodeixis includens TaxID=689277 RepID=A0A9P0E194_CHRIL|nr:unnamed protein product [Chrysodeixis includens]